MLDRIPNSIDPFAFCEKRKVLSGNFLPKDCHRLQDLLFDHEGEIHVEFGFDKERRQPVINGHLSGCLNLVCQSCLESVQWCFDKTFKLGVVNSIDQADRLTIDCEPLVVSEDSEISLLELAEDELLLALPDFPKHEHLCGHRASDLEVDSEASNNHHNPFSVLANLKITGE
jgi:uncharacterized protein